MARKKHPAARRSNVRASPPQAPSPPRPEPAPIASSGTVFLDILDLDPDLDPSIREASQLALSCAKQGNALEGFQIIQESISRHPKAVALLRTRAFMHFQAGVTATNINMETRAQHLRDGAAYAEQAFALCPNLIGLMVVYTRLLFLLANDKAEYENVIQLCQKALSIQDPVDPDKDVAVYQNETDRMSMEARIESAKRELRVLIEELNEAAMNAEKGSKDDAVKKKKSAQSDDEMWKPFIKSRKSQEVKRLEIEKELDQVRVWQHELYMGGVEIDEKGRERHVSNLDRKSRVYQYWKGLSGEEQRAFLKVDVSELEDFYKSDPPSSVILNEAMKTMKELRSWKFWECSSCRRWFVDRELWRQHLHTNDHFGVLPAEDVKALPRGLDAMPVWLDKIVNGVWRPVDVDETLKPIAEQAKEKKEIGHDVAGETEEKMKVEEMIIDEEKWSYCDDAKRKGLLERIRSMFCLFLSNKCLSDSMVGIWLRLTIFQLKEKSPNLWQLTSELRRTPLGFCFLESEQLEMLYRMICEIYKNCQMVGFSKDGGCYDEVPVEEEYRETIDYTVDFSCLLLDERLLTGEFRPQNSTDVVDDENFVYWLHTGAETRELLKSWAGVKYKKRAVASEAYQFLCTELDLLQSLCSKKSLISNYGRAFQEVWTLHENKIRLTMLGRESQNLVQLLNQQRNMHKNVYNVITDILRDAQAASAENLGSEGALFGIDTQESDLGAHENEEHQMKDSQLIDAEHCAMKVLELKRIDLERKFYTVEAFLMKSLADIKRMEQNFGLLSAYDFQAIMLHLLKSFIRSHLEIFAEKDAEEKAKAAEKSLLATLALDSNKRKEEKKSKNVGKKSKKKKAFYKRKLKDKVPSRSEETIEPQKENEGVSFPATSSDGISGSLTIDESRELEQQLMPTAETLEDQQLMHLIESEGMTLEEMIENQRRIEEEIEQNRLEEQNMEMNETVSDNVEDDIPLVSSTGEAEEPGVSEPPQNSQAVTNPGDSIFFGTIPGHLFPRPREGDGSSNRNLPLPTEAYTEPGETNIPAEHKQVEMSGQTTLPAAGTAEVGNSLPQARNVGLGDTGNVSGEDENVPDLEVGVHNPDVDDFDDLDVLTMDQVLPYDRFFNRTNIKRCKVCISFVSEDQDRGYSSA